MSELKLCNIYIHTQANDYTKMKSYIRMEKSLDNF